MNSFLPYFVQNGVIWGTELALEYMGKHKGNHGGVVINTASLSGIAILILANLHPKGRRPILFKI